MTLLTERYSYTPISRESVEGKRLYATPDGSKVPSVTTILDKTKPEEKRISLANWRKSVGEKKAQEITTEAANRGTRMHKYLEDYVKTGTIQPPGTNPYSKQSHAMAQVVIQQGLCNVNEIWGVEVPLYFPGLYAGTTDGLGLHLNEQAIIDYKQTNKPKKEEWIEDYYLQLTAYALAHNEVHGTNINKGVVLMCVQPKLNEKLEMIDVPVYQEFILKPTDFGYWERRWWDWVEEYYKYN
jgi:ATP-dependent exoDNAse (exonuclease V) beta subunit